MVKLITLFAVFCSFVAVTFAFQKTYRNYKVFRVQLQPSTFDYVTDELYTTYQADFWSGPSKLEVSEFMIAPQYFTSVIKFLRSEGMQPELVVNDVAPILRKAIRDEKRSRVKRAVTTSLLESRKFETAYLSYLEVTAIMRELKAKYPTLVELFEFGYSYQGRNMTVLKIKPNASKRVVFIDAGIHAREWLSVSTNVNIMVWMLEEYAKGNTTIKRFVDYYEFNFVPLINPDGYTFTIWRDRIWRKNRHYTGACHGVDLNRNWDAFFATPPPNERGRKCSEVFPGAFAFSEPESRTLKFYLETLAGRGALFLDLHCFGRIFLFPWGYKAELPANYEQLNRIAQVTVKKMQDTFNTTWKVGTPHQTLGYIGGGSSMDWVKNAEIFQMSYAWELAPSKSQVTGRIGFIRPPEEILPTAHEGFLGLLTLLDAMGQ